MVLITLNFTKTLKYMYLKKDAELKSKVVRFI